MKSSMPLPTRPVPPVTSTTFLLLRDIASAPVWWGSIVVWVSHPPPAAPCRIIIMGLPPSNESGRPSSSNQRRAQSIPKGSHERPSHGRSDKLSERLRAPDDERAHTRSCCRRPHARTHTARTQSPAACCCFESPTIESDAWASRCWPNRIVVLDRCLGSAGTRGMGWMWVCVPCPMNRIDLVRRGGTRCVRGVGMSVVGMPTETRAGAQEAEHRLQD